MIQFRDIQADGMPLGQQTTKTDLVDIARAVGVLTVRDDMSVDVVRALIREQLPTFAPKSSRQATKADLFGIAAALGIAVNRRHTVGDLRAAVRANLLERVPVSDVVVEQAPAPWINDPTLAVRANDCDATPFAASVTEGFGAVRYAKTVAAYSTTRGWVRTGGEGTGFNAPLLPAELARLNSFERVPATVVEQPAPAAPAAAPAPAKPAEIMFHVPERPYSPIDSLNRRAAALGSPRYGQLASHANYNGHRVAVQFNSYRQYWTAEYFWAGRVVLARGNFAQCIAAALREHERGALGSSVVVHLVDGSWSASGDELEQALVICRALPQLVEGRAPQVPDWYTWRHTVAAQCARDSALPNSRPTIFDWDVMQAVDSEDAYLEAIRAKHGRTYQ